MTAFLAGLLQRHLSAAIDWKPIEYRSKNDLLTRLPDRLNGYARYDPEFRPKVLVLVDRDDDDCVALKAQLEDSCAAVGLNTITRRAAIGSYDVVNRIVIEELEAWFFGDFVALDAGWEGLGRRSGKAAYRNPDAVLGGTHEALFRLMKSTGYLRGLDRLPKIETARTMGLLVDPERNTSHSFQIFWQGLSALAEVA